MKLTKTSLIAGAAALSLGSLAIHLHSPAKRAVASRKIASIETSIQGLSGASYNTMINEWRDFVENTPSLAQAEQSINSAIGCDYGGSTLCILLTLSTADLSGVQPAQAQEFTEFAWSQASRNPEAYANLIQSYLDRGDPGLDFLRPAFLKQLSMIELPLNSARSTQVARQIPSDQLRVFKRVPRTTKIVR